MNRKALKSVKWSMAFIKTVEVFHACDDVCETIIACLWDNETHRGLYYIWSTKGSFCEEQETCALPSWFQKQYRQALASLMPHTVLLQGSTASSFFPYLTIVVRIQRKSAP